MNCFRCWYPTSRRTLSSTRPAERLRVQLLKDRGVLDLVVTCEQECLRDDSSDLGVIVGERQEGGACCRNLRSWRTPKPARVQAPTGDNVSVSSRLRALAQETVQIIDCGRYQAPGGGEVALAADIAAAVAGTRLYLPGDPVTVAAPDGEMPAVEVTSETSLAAARRLGGDVACLVFASARKPGGGFLNGAQAQEESLARASALHACQRAAPQFYAFHRQHPDLRYSDRVIYSPAVPVFRDDDGTLLRRPYPVSFLTAAAPNLAAIRAGQRQAASTVPAVLRARAYRVLEVAAAHRHRRLVLGAWGCGVFGNDPAVVAAVFAEALDQARWFEQIVFAVYDRQPGTPVYQSFASVLTGQR